MHIVHWLCVCAFVRQSQEPKSVWINDIHPIDWVSFVEFVLQSGFSVTLSLHENGEEKKHTEMSMKETEICTHRKYAELWKCDIILYGTLFC